MNGHYERIPYLVVFPDTATHRDTYGGPGHLVALESYLLKPPPPATPR